MRLGKGREFTFQGLVSLSKRTWTCFLASPWKLEINSSKLIISLFILRLSTSHSETIVLEVGLDDIVTSEVLAMRHLLRLKERFSLGDSKRDVIGVEALVAFSLNVSS